MYEPVKLKYKVCSLTFESEIELPELVTDDLEVSDVSVVLGKVPDNLPSPTGLGVLFQATNRDFLIRIPQIAAYYVQNGSKITIQPYEHATLEEIRIFLLGSVLGALIYQRGLIPIHGSSIVFNHQALIISGLSSSGKSTLAAGLSKLGYEVLADDISVLKKQEKKFFVQPGIPHLKLWQDVIEQLQITDNLIKLRPTIEKYRQVRGPIFHEKPELVSRLVFLEIKNSNDFTSEKIKGIQKFDLLRNCLYRRQYISAMGLDELIFQDLTQFCNSIDVYRVGRPSYPLLINDLVNFIEENILGSMYTG